MAALGPGPPPALLWRVLSVPNPRDCATEARGEWLERATALALLAPLTAAHAIPSTVFSAWIRSAPYQPITIVCGGLDAAGGVDVHGQRRLSAPPGALGETMTPTQAHRLLFGPSPGCDDAQQPPKKWRWSACDVIFDPPPTEPTQNQASADAVRATSQGGIEDCFELFAGLPLAWVVTASPVSDSEADAEQRRLSHLFPSLRNKAGSAESHRLTLERAEAWYRELAMWRPHGVWTINIRVGATDEALARRAAAVLTGAPELQASHYRFLPDEPASPQPANIATEAAPRPGWVSAEVLASLSRSPFREVPGVRVVRPPRFDLTPEPEGDVDVGFVLDRNLLQCGIWSVPLASLNRHVFVSGATGSGKSATVRTILESLSRLPRPVPWLVIEPAKAEYARLGARLPAGLSLLVLRPGDPDLVACGLNPLEPEAGFPLQTHIDMIQALFTAAFEADEPFPQVLDRALTRCYEDRRYDLSTGKPLLSWQTHSMGVGPAWPALLDLQNTARQVVDDIGYGREVADNVRGFIDVRIGSLRTGSCGRFFEGGHPLDIPALLKSNVVIELENLGSDADKAFLIGVVLIRIVEYLRLHPKSDEELRHLLVVEEAHRLLKNAPTGSRAAQSVTLFADLLAEIRAYGEGVAVVEQIPSKILPDVVKNSAVKIMHRLPSADDREFVGATMNLDEDGSNYVVSLIRGDAVVHTDGMDRPCLIRMHHGGDREGRGTVRPTPLSGSRYVECGPPCSNGAAEVCTTRAIAHAEEMLVENPSLSVWAEAQVAAHIIGGGYVLSATPALMTLAATTGARLATCTLSVALHRAITSRYALLAQFYDPSLLGKHLRDAANETLHKARAGQPPKSLCTGPEPSYQAGKRRFVDLLEQLDADQLESLEPALSHEIERRARVTLPPGTSPATAASLLREHPWSRYAQQHKLYWGTSKNASFDIAIRATTGRQSPRRRETLEYALQMAGFTDAPWFVVRLQQQKD
jgi:hypothetical protein